MKSDLETKLAECAEAAGKARGNFGGFAARCKSLPWPALSAAVRLAQSANALYESYGDAAWWASQWCDFEEKVAAFRAAKRQENGEKSS